VGLVKIFRVGVDFGFHHDPTAMVVAEAVLDEERTDTDGEPLVIFEARFVERMPLGTRTQDVVDRIAEVVEKLKEKAAFPRIEAFVDATGVGIAVKDLLAPALRQHGVLLHPVMITSGTRERREGGILYVPKEALVQRLGVLLDQGRVFVPPQERDLQHELEAFRINISEKTRRPKYGAAPGEHDDLVIALALAVYREVHWRELVSGPRAVVYGL